MSDKINHDDIQEAAERLVRSERGAQAAIDLLAMLENGAMLLDEENQAAVQTILTGAWGGLSGATLDALRDKTGN